MSVKFIWSESGFTACVLFHPETGIGSFVVVDENGCFYDRNIGRYESIDSAVEEAKQCIRGQK